MKTVDFTLRLPADLAEEIDVRAKLEGRKRSPQIIYMLRQLMLRQQRDDLKAAELSKPRETQ